MTYTAALGYNSMSSIIGTTKNDTLGKKNFGLAYTESTSDEFGRPYYVWFDSRDTKTGAYVSGTSTLYATVKATPVKTYTTAVTECDVAHDYGFAKTKTFDVYTNGVYAKDGDTLNAINTVDKIGAQGRLTEVYKDRIVYIDTLLAEVAYVANATFDAAGHLKTPATITLNVYDADKSSAPYYEYTTVTETNGSTNYEYAKGDMILVYAVQTAASKVDTTAAKQYVELNGKADSVVGAQSTIWNNNAKHVIGGTTYDDNNRFHFDQAGTEVTNHTWYFDSYGNLIGASDIVSTNYAVLKDLIWVNGNPGHAEATLIDLKGEESKVTVSAIDGAEGTSFIAASFTWNSKTYAPKYTDANKPVQFLTTSGTSIAYVSNDGLYNDLYKGYAMYRVDTKLDGTVALVGYNTVSYLHDAKFASNNSAILKSDGTVGKYVSSNTQYLVRTVDVKGVVSYTPVAGTQAMAAYSKADLFYVDYNNDSIADYVYIKSGTLDTAASALVYVTTDAYTGPLTEGNTTVYTMVATVNGEAGKTLTLDGLTAAKLAANKDKLFKVSFTNGVATSAELINAYGATNVSTGTYAIYMAGDALKGEIYTDGATLYSTKSEPISGTAGFSCRIDGATVINAATGDYTSLTATVLRDNGIWVVYKTSPYNTATTIYVGNKLGSTAAKALAAVPANTDFGTLTVSVAAGTNLDSKVLELVNAKLAAAGVTGVTATLNATWPVTAPAVGTSEVKWFQIEYVDANGNTASAGSCTITVANEPTAADLNATIKSTVEGLKTVTAASTKTEIVTAVKTALNTAGVATADLTVDVTIPVGVHAGDKVIVNVTGKVGTTAVSVTGAEIIVQA